jgi:hypothetical protein
MRHSVLISTIAALSLSFIGCGEARDRQQGSGVEQTITSAVAEQTGAVPANDIAPCELLDEALLNAHFEIAQGTAITREPSRHSPFPLCTATWPKPNAAEIEQQGAKRMQEWVMQRGDRGPMPIIRTENSVSLTIYQPAFRSRDQAIAEFDNAMAGLEKGIRASHEGTEVEFQADLTPVSGVGDKAMWAPSMRQLSVVSNTRIFHVGVNTGAERDQELATARALATQLAGRIR